MMYIADAMAPPRRSPASSPDSSGNRSSTRSGAPAEVESSAAPTTPEYTIDELAALTSVPSRTIRFYQSKGALMPPAISGRVALYGALHVERLKLIAQLQERGLRIDAIRELVKRIERGELNLAEWLGVERELTTSWAHDQARTVTEAELLELAGTKRPGLIADLVRVKLIERHGDVFLVESPALLAIALKLEATGIDQDTLALAADILRKHLGRAVSELSDLLIDRARKGALSFADDPSKLFETLRPMGLEAVRIVFAKQAERALRKVVESGTLASLGARKKSRGHKR
jgi:DNA-binding transcriptional MerR regulator